VDDRRAETRITWQARATIFVGSRQLVCEVQNLSAAAVLVVPPERIAPGQFVRLNLELPGLEQKLDLDAVALREASSDGRYAVALQFLQLSQRSQTLLRTYVSSAAAQPAAQERRSAPTADDQRERRSRAAQRLMALVTQSGQAPARVPTGPQPTVPPVARVPTGPQPVVPPVARVPTGPQPVVPPIARVPTGPQPVVPSRARIPTGPQQPALARPRSGLDEAVARVEHKKELRSLYERALSEIDSGRTPSGLQRSLRSLKGQDKE